MKGVDFMRKEEYVDTYIKNNQKSGWVAYLLLIFLGFFGAHRMYMGKMVTGIIQLILTLLFSWWTLSLIPGLWLIIDIFLIPIMLRQNKNKLHREALMLYEERQAF